MSTQCFARSEGNAVAHGAALGSAEMAAVCVGRGWLSPEAAAIAATEPLADWLVDVLRTQGVTALESGFGGGG